MIIDKPGVFDGVPATDYHSVITPEPALSSSGARALIAECPAYFWFHSEINPDRPTETNANFDLGQVAHLLVLEPDKVRDRVVVLQYDDYRKDAARYARDEARAHGYIPLLVDQFAVLQEARDAIAAHPVARHAFAGAAVERTYVWRDPATGRWLKCRPDVSPANGRYGADLKTAASANPEQFARSIANFGYGQQAAWCLDGMRAAGGMDVPDRFAFVVVAKSPPYLVSVVWLDVDDIARGRELNRRAIAIFDRCASAGWGREHWPGYQADGAETISQPAWARKRQDELIQAAITFQAPLAGDAA